MIKELIQKCRRIFTRQTKKKLIGLCFAIAFGSLLDTAALSIISPFITLFMAPESIASNRVMEFFYTTLGFRSANGFIGALAFLLAFVYIFRGVYMYFVNKKQYRFIGKERVDLCDRLLNKIINEPYLFHTNHNIAEMQRIILTDVEQMFNMITSILFMMADIFMTTFMVVYLFTVSPPITAGVIGVASLCALLYLKFFRQRVRDAGDQTRKKYIAMTKAVNQALGGIKEVKILKRESFFQKAFKKNSDEYVNAFQHYQTMNAMPRMFIEALCFGLAFAALGVVLLLGNDVSGIIPLLSVFVLAAFRLLPAISRLASYATTIFYNYPSVTAVYNSLFAENEYADKASPSRAEPNSNKNENIEFSHISFRYPKAEAPVLSDVSLVIPQRMSVAFVGASGAGKTTLADILLGILTPREGYVTYKGKSIHENEDGWARQIGYIPQQIYLLDESILENVAFGVERDQIDEKKAWHALEQAQIKDFVAAQPQGIHTIIGDRGIRLSGGQRQRIGIARALYEDPSILVLDEATSSLDNDTEKAVMNAIQHFQGHKTMVIVAHRLSTIEHCDIIYRVENGKVTRER